MFSDGVSPTDDSILTFATADWIMHGGAAWKHYVKYASKYDCPVGGYGGGFTRYVIKAVTTGKAEPYNSCGNGSAMRISPVGWAFNTREEVFARAKESAECTHNHPEGIKGAQATALAIFMARNGASIGDIKTAIEMEFGYNIGFTLDELRPEYSWNYPEAALCQGTVPQAIRCVYEATSYEIAFFTPKKFNFTPFPLLFSGTPALALPQFFSLFYGVFRHRVPFAEPLRAGT